MAINKDEYYIEHNGLTFYAYELKTPNESTTSDIVGFFVEDETQDGSLKMLDYLFGCTLMSNDDIMAELERIAKSYNG